MKQEPVLEVKNLTKKFGPSADGFTAVDNISFSVGDGEILGLLGPNGAGKTTTIQMLLGVMTPTAGKITYFGKPFKEHREDILKQVNYSSTYISLPWQFTVMEILDVFARLYEVKDRKKRIKKLLQEFEIEHLASRQFFMLSSGEKTRLFLVKAFINYPKLILLDEPTASLDIEIAAKVREFLKKEKEQYSVSMLFTSHNMSEVEEMCDRVLMLNRGVIVDEGAPHDLTKLITDCEVELTIVEDRTRTMKFLQEKEFPFENHKYRFIVPVDERHIAEFLSLLAHEGISYEEINIRKPDLEDYFMKILIEERGKQ